MTRAHSDRNTFITERRSTWDELHHLTENLSGRASFEPGTESGRASFEPGGGTPVRADQLRRVGTLYRATASDLAIARANFPKDPLLGELEQVLAQGRGFVYPRVPRSFSPTEFYKRRYWRLIRERPWHLSASVAIVLVSTVAVFIWALKDPTRASTLLGSRFHGGRESFGDQGYSANQQSSVATSIFLNNIRVSFMVFALGITLGIGSALMLMFNGALLGLVAGLAVKAGHGDVAFSLIYGHGFLELTVIVVASAAGMRIGWAIVDPGYRPRSLALREEALNGVEIVAGTIPFFVLAGLVEGFFTPAGFGPLWAGVVGTFFGVSYWTLLLWRGSGSAPVRTASVLSAS